MISFSEFLLETPAAITGPDAEELRQKMTSFIADSNNPSTRAFNSIRTGVRDIGNSYYVKKNGMFAGFKSGVELYRAVGGLIDIMTYLSINRYPDLGKALVIESVAKLNENTFIDNSIYLDKLQAIKVWQKADIILSDVHHTPGGNHLWIKLMSIARNNGHEIGVYNTSTKKLIPIVAQSVAMTVRKAGYLTNPNMVFYIK